MVNGSSASTMSPPCRSISTSAGAITCSKMQRASASV